MPGDAFVELKLACYAELLCYLDDNNLVGQLAKLNLMQRPPNIEYYSSLCRPRPVCCGKILSNNVIIHLHCRASGGMYLIGKDNFFF